MLVRKIFALLTLCAALTACGNKDNNQQPVVGGPYAYNVGPEQNLCPTGVALEWNRLIASRCNNVQAQNQAQARACVWGTKEFQTKFPSINCNIAVQEVQWCPGDNWRSQKFFTINDPVIQSIYDKYGWASGGTGWNGGGWNGGWNNGPNPGWH